MDLDEDDDEVIPVNNHHRHQIIDESNGITNYNEDNHAIINKTQPYSTTNNNNKTKTTTKLFVQDNNNNLNEQQTGVGQQDEWEEFEDPNSKYDRLRLKFSRATNDEDENYDDDDDHNDENNHHTNLDENPNNIDGGDDEQTSRNNRRREQQKDKPAWKLDQVKQTESILTNESNDLPTEKVEEPPSSKPATSGVYRPPQLRGNSSVTIVSGVNQRVSKKEKPNLASTEEFPTLGAAVNKK